MSTDFQADPSTPKDSHPAHEPFSLEWLEQAGASFPKLRIDYLEGGERGVFARADIAPGEEVLRVPRGCLLTFDVASASDIGRRIAAHAPSASEESCLAAFLLQERSRENSCWKPYLDPLPAAFPHLPLFFDEHDLSFLKGSAMLGEVARWRALLLGEYAFLCERVPGFSRFTPDAFLWAQLVLVSRTFGMKLGGKLVRCFVPLADMLNHRQSPHGLWGPSADETAFVLVAREAVSAGEEFHISYGVKSNFRFLLNYGFVPEDNPQDELLLHLGIPESDPLALVKRELLGLSSPTALRRFEVPLYYDHATTAAMFSFLRVAHANEEELASITSAANASGGLGVIEPLSVDNEERVLRTLGELCEARLAGFETTLEEDEQLLRDAELSRNARTCLLLRRGEKRLLHAFAGLARTFLPTLRSASPGPEDTSAQSDQRVG
ncbi:MAG: SET domain-containing histone-lysine N-methyltransferase [Hyalangium sp.]|uniref:SET domain-containing histone-lysine N-methyltransferase n=1 Tax=Hyalangium sp. TaxID=2028555 RepID=UPI00389AF99A